MKLNGLIVDSDQTYLMTNGLAMATQEICQTMCFRLLKEFTEEEVDGTTKDYLTNTKGSA